jgi:hypothetical protein
VHLVVALRQRAVHLQDHVALFVEDDEPAHVRVAGLAVVREGEVDRVASSAVVAAGAAARDGVEADAGHSGVGSQREPTERNMYKDVQ